MVNFKLVSYGVQKGEKYTKTLLNTKRRILFRGSFVLVKGKAFETRGENFKHENASQNSYSFTFDYLQKTLKKTYKRICKNKTCGANVVQNVKDKETIHAYLVSDFYWLNSKQPSGYLDCHTMEVAYGEKQEAE